MRTQDRLLRISRLVVSLAKIVNRLFVLAVIVALLLSSIFANHLMAFLTQSNPGIDASSASAGLRFEMLVGILMAVATDRLLVNLGSIVASASDGDPFNGANARRLQTIGWSLLLLQLLDFPAMVLSRTYPSLGSASPLGDFSAGGWMAVLMVFVLSRVFAQGSIMRSELDGTV